MGRRYSVSGSAAVGTSVTLVGMTSNANVRPKLYDLVVGCAATPADQSTLFRVLRYTAAGTNSSFTPVALDPADPASQTAGAITFTGEPTYTANSQTLTISMNQRATFRWVAAPMSEIVAPATASNGLGLRSVSATGSASHDAVVLFEE